MPSFGDWLREERERRKMTLQDLVDQGAGCTVSYLSNLERNYPLSKDGEFPRPRKRIAAAIGRALECGEDEALRAAGYSTGPDVQGKEEIARFAERLRVAMAQRNVGPSALADAIGGVTAQSVDAWTQGENYPQAAKLPVIAKVLGCSIDWLMGDDELPATQLTTKTVTIADPEHLGNALAQMQTQLNSLSDLMRDFYPTRRQNRPEGAACAF